MTTQRITFGPDHIEAIIPIPSDQEPPVSYQTPYNRPYSDELLLHSVNEAGVEQNYIVRLHINAFNHRDQNVPEVGSTVHVTDATNGRISGQVVWVDDEDPAGGRPLTTKPDIPDPVETYVGYLLPEGLAEFPPESYKEFDVDFEKMKAKILKVLGLEKGQLITLEKKKEIEAKMAYLEEFYQQDLAGIKYSFGWSAKPQDQGVEGHALSEVEGHALSEVEGHALSGVEGQELSYQGITLRIFLMPSPKEIVPNLVPAPGVTIPDGEAIKVASLFDKPLSRENTLEGLQKVTEYFDKHPNLHIANPPDQQVFAFNEKGQLVLNLLLDSNPKALEFHVTHLDPKGKPEGENHYRPGGKTPFTIKLPPSTANRAANRIAIMEYYGSQGRLVEIEEGPKTNELGTYMVKTQRAPTKIEIKGSLGPELKKKIDDGGWFKKDGKITTLSIAAGMAELNTWIATRGFLMKGGHPSYSIEGDTLTLHADAATISAITFIHTSGKLKREDTADKLGMKARPGGQLLDDGEDKKETIIDDDHELAGLKNRLEVATRPGEPFSAADLNTAIARINSGHSLDAIHEQTIDETGRVSVRVRVKDRLRGEVILGADESSMGGFVDDEGRPVEAVSGRGRVGGEILLSDGKRVGGSVSWRYSGTEAAPNTVITAEGHVTIPDVDLPGLPGDLGTQATVGVSGSYARANSDGTPNAFPHSVGAYGSLDIPLARHSPWGVITGIGVSTSIRESDSSYLNTWIRPTVGLRHRTAGSSTVLKTGPRLNDTGDFFWEAELDASRTVPVTEQSALEMVGSAGVMVGPDSLPDYLKYNPAHGVIGYGGNFVQYGTYRAGLMVHYMFQPDGIPVPSKVGRAVSDLPILGILSDTREIPLRFIKFGPGWGVNVIGEGDDISLWHGGGLQVRFNDVLSTFVGPNWHYVNGEWHFKRLGFGISANFVF